MARPDRPDLAALFMTEFAPLVRTLRLVAGDYETAEDLAQEAFVRAFKNWRRLQRYDDPVAAIRRIGINLALNARRDRARRPRAAEIDIPVEASFSDPEVFNALRALPRQQRAAIVLCLIEDRPTAEVADMIGCSEATVRVHLHRARQTLMRVLGESESSDVTG